LRDAISMARAQTRSFVRVVGDRIRQDRGLRLLTAVAMVGFVLIVYAVVVVGGGELLGRSGSPSVWLSVVATATVAIAFEPVRTHAIVGCPGRCTRIGFRPIRCSPASRTR